MKENFRKFFTSKKTKVLAGKNAEQNEELVKKYIGKENIITHTAKPGSPFCVILGKAKKGDLKEVALFTAKYSREWKKAKIKKDVEVHYFKGKDVYKEKNMKTGTFGVKKYKEIKVKRGEIKKLENDKACM